MDKAWGVHQLDMIPAWQRGLLKALNPLLRKLVVNLTKIGGKGPKEGLENGIKVFVKFSAIMLICIISFYTSLFMMFLNMCTYSTGDVLFLNRENNEIIIAERYFGCGATDSSPASMSIEKIESFAFLLSVQ